MKCAYVRREDARRTDENKRRKAFKRAMDNKPAYGTNALRDKIGGLSGHSEAPSENDIQTEVIRTEGSVD